MNEIRESTEQLIELIKNNTEEKNRELLLLVQGVKIGEAVQQTKPETA